VPSMQLPVHRPGSRRARWSRGSANFHGGLGKKTNACHAAFRLGAGRDHGLVAGGLDWRACKWNSTFDSLDYTVVESTVHLADLAEPAVKRTQSCAPHSAAPQSRLSYLRSLRLTDRYE
jgi:hypothetical protein